MKKNSMLRAAAVVLVLILLSTCWIGATYAKYITNATGHDGGRVAIWGIAKNFDAPDADGDALFKASYEQSVSSHNGDQLVAPGTSDQYTFGFRGAPEVAYTVYMGIKGDPVDVKLLSGSYTFPEGSAAMSVTAAEDYLPLRWTVRVTTAHGSLTDTAGKFVHNGQYAEAQFNSLAEIQAALDTVSVSYGPGQDADVRVLISWEWPFEGEQDAYSDQDRMDTILGLYISLAQGRIDKLPFETQSGAVTDVDYTFTMTAVQED